MPEYHSLKVTAGCCCMSDLVGLEVWRECCYAASLQVRKEKKKSHLLSIKVPLNIVPPEKAASYYLSCLPFILNYRLKSV